MEKELSRVPRLLSESYNSGLIERLYDSGGSVMLDIIIYLCGNHIRDLFGESWFSIEDFCNKKPAQECTRPRFFWMNSVRGNVVKSAVGFAVAISAASLQSGTNVCPATRR